MRKVLFFLMFIFASFTYGQRLSVLGIKMGTSIEDAEKLLKERYGEYEIHRKGLTELKTYNALVGGSEFHNVSFEFQVARYETVAYTFLYYVELQKNFRSYKSAKSMFNVWEERLLDKYTVEDVKRITKPGQREQEETVFFKEGVCLELTYSESKGGESFWYVIISYYEDIIGQSSDY